MTSTYKILNGDISINPSNGHPDIVSDLLKIKQDVKELLLIDIQTDNGFGSSLIDMIGSLPDDDLSPGSINFHFSMKIQNAFNRLIQLQRMFQFGQRTALELIDKILLIRAEPSRTDPTLYRFLVRIKVLAGSTISLGGNLST
jgi:hypothetical protein